MISPQPEPPAADARPHREAGAFRVLFADDPAHYAEWLHLWEGIARLRRKGARKE